MPEGATSGWARFWSVDLHVHTPGSGDAQEMDFGGPDEIVQAALDAGLAAIAVTDHNTAAWCDRMSQAAEGTSLIVLPGFELSTADGHLLGIWDEGTTGQHLEDVLLQLGITRDRLGDLNMSTPRGMGDCAAQIDDAGGVAIAAHIDRERGLLKQPVQTHVNGLLAHPSIAGFEYVNSETPALVEAKLQGLELPALVRHSDAYDPALSRHAGSAIGRRRTWYKAARPDLIGIRYALEDPALRIRTADPCSAKAHSTVDSVHVDGGFLVGTTIDLSPDLNCFLGGTGAGKSLVLESIRFALDQQVDGELFKSIRKEVDLRLEHALGVGTTVRIEGSVDGERYRISRTFALAGSLPKVEQQVDAEWVTIERRPSELILVAAFSQGEILEYSRQPVGRVGLIDAQLSLHDLDSRILAATNSLQANSRTLIQQRDRMAELAIEAARVTDLTTRERELSDLFDPQLVADQRLWTGERGDLAAHQDAVDKYAAAISDLPELPSERLTQHMHAFDRLRVQERTFREATTAARRLVSEAKIALSSELALVREELDAEYVVFQTTLQTRLEQSGQTSMGSLLRELQSVQTALATAAAAAAELNNVAGPALQELNTAREVLLSELKAARDERRDRRRSRVRDLNKKTAGFVKLDLPSRSDRSKFRALLEVIKVGSHLSTNVLDTIAESLHPYGLVRAIWSGDHSLLGALPAGVSATDIGRLQTNVADRNLWNELLELQAVELPDRLDVKFRKPEGGEYVAIENLSHGQKCTAVLVILLADGNMPVLVDQPEDALHAPWIEDYLVDRLRNLRGTRQYVFATRSAGLVVSADSEQLVTMRATADRGEVEARGSLERHDVNALALHHLEGGKVPFGRRARKLRASITL